MFLRGRVGGECRLDTFADHDGFCFFCGIAEKPASPALRVTEYLGLLLFVVFRINPDPVDALHGLVSIDVADRCNNARHLLACVVGVR